MDINNLALDQKKMRDGVWRKHPLAPDARVRVRLRGCKQAREWWAENAPREGTFENGVKIDAEWLALECLARVYLTDWEGWTDGGEPVPFSHDVASEWVHAPSLEQWANVTMGLCDDAELYRQKKAKEAGKS